MDWQPKDGTDFRHGDAWRRFRHHTAHKGYSPEEIETGWVFFLKGWLEKAKQADEIRGRITRRL